MNQCELGWPLGLAGWGILKTKHFPSLSKLSKSLKSKVFIDFRDS